MTQAESLVLAASYAAATSFEYGYFVTYEGTRVHFKAPRRLEEKRNKTGRCTLWRGQCDDGSIIHFTWSPSNGSRFTASRKPYGT
jgi:hypothetical protein